VLHDAGPVERAGPGRVLHDVTFHPILRAGISQIYEQQR
jgi:hypothetical protein